MPCQSDDAQFTEKKKHIGNDNVTIVYNDSGEEYRISTIKVCPQSAVNEVVSGCQWVVILERIEQK